MGRFGVELPTAKKLNCGRQRRPDPRRRVEDCRGRLTVRQWRAGSRPDGLDSVALVTSPQHFGGVRYWFACPACSRRVGLLYRPHARSAWRCRHCHDLAYRSAQEAHANESLWAAVIAIEVHLELNRGWDPVERLFAGRTPMETLALCRAVLYLDRMDRLEDEAQFRAAVAAAKEAGVKPASRRHS